MPAFCGVFPEGRIGTEEGMNLWRVFLSSPRSLESVHFRLALVPLTQMFRLHTPVLWDSSVYSTHVQVPCAFTDMHILSYSCLAHMIMCSSVSVST